MNQQSSTNIAALSSQISDISFEDVINRVYPDRTDLENIQLAQMTLAEFVYLSRRVFDIFSNASREREIMMVLPAVYTHGQFGNANVEGQIQNYFTYVNQGNLATAENALLWLAGYQVEYGIYEKYNSDREESISVSLESLSERLKLIQISIEKKHTETQALLNQLTEANRDATILISQKREELNQITVNLTTSNTQANQISEILTRSTEQNSRINSLVEQQEIYRQQEEKKLREFQEIYSEANKVLEDNSKTVAIHIDEFKKQAAANQEHLNFVEGKRSFFEERINYLENLIGREVGASLFETFKQRKVELHKPVLFWRWAVPAMAIATILWIIFLFSQQTIIKDVNEWWQVFTVNTLKSIPAIFLLLFTINQYRKERNFQEEYAFKSAVALTIDAYSSRINDLANKDKLIIEAVLNVYKTPIDDKQTGRIKTKTALETIKTMADTTKELIKK